MVKKINRRLTLNCRLRNKPVVKILQKVNRRTVVQNAKKSDKKGKNEKFTSITKMINLRTSGFRFLSPNLFMPLDIFFEVINCF